MKIVAPQLVVQTMAQNRHLKLEVAALQDENELLRVENKNLHSKNIELRDKLSVIRVIAS
jgi:regulator of replication initiation timing